MGSLLGAFAQFQRSEDERLVGGLAVGAGQDQGVGLPTLLGDGLAQPTTGRTSEKPLQLRRGRPAQGDDRGCPIERSSLDLGEAPQLSGGKRPGRADSGEVLKPATRPVEGPQGASGTPALRERDR